MKNLFNWLNNNQESEPLEFEEQGGAYKSRFLTKQNISKRGEKSIYILAEFHERLSRIAQVIGGDKIPLYAYLDNILEHHFDMFEQIITEDYNNNIKPIFQNKES